MNQEEGWHQWLAEEKQEGVCALNLKTQCRNCPLIQRVDWAIFRTSQDCIFLPAFFFLPFFCFSTCALLAVFLFLPDLFCILCSDYECFHSCNRDIIPNVLQSSFQDSKYYCMKMNGDDKAGGNGVIVLHAGKDAVHTQPLARSLFWFLLL